MVFCFSSQTGAVYCHLATLGNLRRPDACHYQRISDPPIGTRFTVYGQGAFLGVPGPVLLFLVAAAVLVWVLRSTRFGRNLYAIGGNRDAAVLVGIPVLRMELLVYALAGMFAALAGIMYASRMDAAQPAVGEGWLMKAITAAILAEHR